MFRNKRHRQATRVASAVLAGLGALATGVYGNASEAASSVKIGVPAYFWPGGNWDRVVAGSTDVSLAVVNIATGPGAVGNHTIGASALGGMLFGTIFGVIIIPGLYFIFGSIAAGRKLIKNEDESSLTEDLVHKMDDFPQIKEEDNE